MKDFTHKYMALTPEQVQEARQKYGISPQGVASSSRSSSRLQELEQAWSSPSEEVEVTEEVSSPTKKVTDFATSIIGGGKLAEGLGKAIAAPKVLEDLGKAEEARADIETNLIKRIREKTEKGEDSERLKNALVQLMEDRGAGSEEIETFVASLPSNEEVIGSAVRLAGTALAPTIAGQATKLTGAGAATTGLSGVGKGLLSGAVAGGAEGAIQGAGVGVEEGEDFAGVAESALKGGAIGAAIGAPLGAVGGGIAGRVNSAKLVRENFVKDYVSPKLTTKVKAEILEQGRLEEPGFFKKATVEASKRDANLASAVEDVVSPKNSLGENIASIRTKISNTNEGVKAYIKENKVPFNTNQLRKKLNDSKEESKLIFASDTNAEKTYDAVIDEFMKHVETKDTAGLFEARQTVDKIPAIKKLLDSQGLGENVKRQIVLNVRRAANDYIAELLPAGNPYKKLMQQESYMIEALGNISEKNASIIGKNKLQLLTEEYPILKWFVGGLAGAAGIGVGSTIIGSTD